MARGITLRDSLPQYAQALPDRIEALGFGWHFFEERPLPEPGRYVQVRDTGKIAPGREVSKYAVALKRGDQMPPVVVTVDGYVVDGNTRIAAARKAGWKTFPSFVLDVKFEDSPEALRDQMRTLGAAFNLTHGRGMANTEVTKVIEAVAKKGDSPREVSKKLHISENMVQRVMNSRKARDRAESLGVEITGALSGSHLKLFGGKSDKFNNEVFAELFRLAQDAELSIAIVNDLTKQLENLGTDREKLALLAETRKSYARVIKSGTKQPSRSANLRRSLGYITRAEDPEALVEINPDAADGHIRMLRTGLERLEKVLAAQLQVERARTEG